MKTKAHHLALGLIMMLATQITSAAININKASAEEIAKELNGVGSARAEAIVKEREKNGPFKDGQDLASRIKGIGPGTILKNKDRLVFK